MDRRLKSLSKAGAGSSGLICAHPVSAMSEGAPHTGRPERGRPGRTAPLPPLRRAAHWAYRLVANNRERMPGGTSAYAVNFPH